MEIKSIKSTDIELTPNLRKYVEDKIGGCEKFINTDHPVEVYVEVAKTTQHHRKGKIFRAEATAYLPGQTIRAESVREDIYLAVTDVKNKFQRELKEYKNRMVDGR